MKSKIEDSHPCKKMYLHNNNEEFLVLFKCNDTSGVNLKMLTGFVNT